MGGSADIDKRGFALFRMIIERLTVLRSFERKILTQN